MLISAEFEFQIGLISQNLSYCVRKTSIMLASANLEHIMTRAAGVLGPSGRCGMPLVTDLKCHH